MPGLPAGHGFVGLGGEPIPPFLRDQYTMFPCWCQVRKLKFFQLFFTNPRTFRAWFSSFSRDQYTMFPCWCHVRKLKFFQLFFTSHLPGMVFLIFTRSTYHISVLVSSAKIKKKRKIFRRRARPRRQTNGVQGARPLTGGSCGGQSPPKCSLSQCRAHAPVTHPGRYRHTPRPVRIPYRALIAEKQSRGTGLTGVCGRSAPPTPRQ